jgi:pyrroloquinoline quinone biosynthesis protein D
VTALTPESVLVRPAWARLKYCSVRNSWMLLVPERVLFPCPTTTDILQRLETPKALGSLTDDLVAEYDAPYEAIFADVVELLGDLVEKGYVRRCNS